MPQKIPDVLAVSSEARPFSSELGARPVHIISHRRGELSVTLSVSPGSIRGATNDIAPAASTPKTSDHRAHAGFCMTPEWHRARARFLWWLVDTRGSLPGTGQADQPPAASLLR